MIFTESTLYIKSLLTRHRTFAQRISTACNLTYEHACARIGVESEDF